MQGQAVAKSAQGRSRLALQQPPQAALLQLVDTGLHLLANRQGMGLLLSLLVLADHGDEFRRHIREPAIQRVLLLFLQQREIALISRCCS